MQDDQNWSRSLTLQSTIPQTIDTYTLFLINKALVMQNYQVRMNVDFLSNVSWVIKLKYWMHSRIIRSLPDFYCLAC